MRCCGPHPRFSLVRRQDRRGCARRPCARPSSTRSPIRLGEVYSSALHMPSEGSSTHCLSQAEKSKLRKRNEPDKNPARTWRQGKAAEVFQKEQVRDLYPDGEPGRNVIPKKSKRMKVCEDKQQEGELYAGQVDTWSQSTGRGSGLPRRSCRAVHIESPPRITRRLLRRSGGRICVGASRQDFAVWYWVSSGRQVRCIASGPAPRRQQRPLATCYRGAGPKELGHHRLPNGGLPMYPTSKENGCRPRVAVHLQLPALHRGQSDRQQTQHVQREPVEPYVPVPCQGDVARNPVHHRADRRARCEMAFFLGGPDFRHGRGGRHRQGLDDGRIGVHRGRFRPGLLQGQVGRRGRARVGCSTGP